MFYKEGEKNLYPDLDSPKAAAPQ